jgi:hypothetical protein
VRVASTAGRVFALTWVIVAAATIGSAHASPFSIAGFDGSTQMQDGSPATQAGSHPFLASTSVTLPLTTEADGQVYPAQFARNISVELPPGLIANAAATPQCTPAQLVGGNGSDICPINSQVGFVRLEQRFGGPSPNFAYSGVYNMVGAPGTPGLLAFNFVGFPITISTELRSGSDYGLTILNRNLPLSTPLGGLALTLWGVPGDSAHNGDRGKSGTGGLTGFSCASPAQSCENPFTATVKPFLTLPTSCEGPVRTALTLTTWEGETASASFLSHDAGQPTPSPTSISGCGSLDFSPALLASPTTEEADSPSGLDLDLHFPQTGFGDPNANVEAALRDVLVTLPDGMVFNPAATNGLGSCSRAAIGLISAPAGSPPTFTKDEAACPDSSKIGIVEIDTPLADHPIQGAAYLAKPYENPSGSLLALYLAAADPETGISFKLVGGVLADSSTGRLSLALEDLPRIPFEDLKLHLFKGRSAPLRTPPICGVYATQSSLTPWSAPASGPPSHPSDSYAIERGPGGGPCSPTAASLPFAPALEAGSASNRAGAATAFVANLRREDGSQEISSFALTPPLGLVARLAGIPACPDANISQMRPECPGSSAVGALTVGVGAGPYPVQLTGRVYLAGPYKGAPLSLVGLTPASAGPFDLGTVAVRMALNVDRLTGAIQLVSDPLPAILSGIPLDIRSISVDIDRHGFLSNPTSCEPSLVHAVVFGANGASSAPSSRFQVSGCSKLAFKPQLNLKLTGGTARNGHPTLTAVLGQPSGRQANIGSISLLLPHSEFLDQRHIRSVCTRVRFNQHSCPSAAVYGWAEAKTPLLAGRLSGPVYLRSSSHRLPDLAVALKGPSSSPIELDLDGRIGSSHGAVRATFDALPDIPVDRFVLRLYGGRRGLLVNSHDLCHAKGRVKIMMIGQNGKRSRRAPLLRDGCIADGSSRGKDRASSAR